MKAFLVANFSSNRVITSHLEGFEVYGVDSAEFTYSPGYDDSIKKALKREISQEFTDVFLDKGRLKISTDRGGRMNVYIYNSNERIAVSNNWWLLLDFLGVNSNELCKEALLEWAYLFYPIGNRTIHPDISYAQPATSYNWDNRAHKLTSERYWGFDEFRENVENSKGLHEHLDESILSCMSVLVRSWRRLRYTIGCSVSGGYDSRLISAYLKDTGVEYHHYSIASKPRVFGIRSRLRSICDKIALLYNTDHITLYDEVPNFSKRMRLDLRWMPFGDSQILKTPERIPKYDVLLNAGGPEMLSTTFTGISSVNDEEKFADWIISKLSLIGYDPEKKHVLIKLFRRIFTGRRIDYLGHNLLTQKSLEVLRVKLQGYFTHNTVQNYREYLYHNIANKSYFGAYESLNGRISSYSILFPFAFDFLGSVPFEEINNRKILMDLLINKVPDVADVPSESSSFSQRTGKFNFRDFFRGKVYEGIAGEKEMKLLKKSRFFSDLSSKNCDLFHELWTDEDLEYARRYNENLFLSLIKIKFHLIEIESNNFKIYYEE